MTNLRTWLRRLRLFLSRDRATRELEDEMRLHRELRAAALGGADPVTNARRTFGNPVQLVEQSRDAWGMSWFDDLRQDVRYAVRRLRQRPAFTASVVVVLALGIGATTAMFSAVDAAMLRPLPFPHAEQLVTLPQIDIPFDPGSGQQFPTSDTHIPDINDIAAMPQYFSSVAGWAVGGLNLSDPERPIRLIVGVVTTSFFHTLSINAAAGRTFTADEGHPGRSHVALLSWGLWQRQFGGRDMINHTIRLNSTSYLVVGVMPRGFSFPEQSDIWIPMTVPTTFDTYEAFRQYLPTSVIARLAPGIARTVASTQLLARWQLGLAPGLRREQDSTGYIHGQLAELRQHGTALPLQQSLVGDHRTALELLLGATGLLLLIACANVANLLLSQSNGRRREIAVREVLGATRTRVVRQLLTESVLLSAAGALAGVLLAREALRVIHGLMPAKLAGVAPAAVNIRLLIFAVLLAFVTGIGLGLWPALGALRGDLSGTIKSGGGHGATGATLGRSRQALVGAELALTVMLLIAAGLMLRSFQRLLGTDSGMNVEHAGSLQLAFPKSLSWHAKRVEVEQILARLNATPGITAAGAVNDLPLGGQGGISLRINSIDDVPETPDNDSRGARDLIASPGYFRAMGIRLISGRTIAPADDSGAPAVAVISAGMAHDFWPGVLAVGKTFSIGDRITVIGVVSDVREQGLEDEPADEMYVPMAQQQPSNVAIVARGTLAPPALLNALRDAVRSVDPAQAVYAVKTMDDVMSQSLAPRRTNTLLITIFAALAFILAAVGVGAVVSYGVTQRGRELGIRSALGASGTNLVALLSKEMAAVAAIGIAAGLAGAWALAHVLSSLIYHVTIHDTVTFIAVPLLVLVAAVVATLLPARRALTVNPMDVMRAE